MKKILNLFSILLVFTNFSIAKPAFANETKQAIDQLKEQLELLQHIKFYTESFDIGRVSLLERSSQNTLTLVETKGLMSNQTFNSYNVLIITYINSRKFLESIETIASQVAIARLIKIVDDIIEQREMPAATQITFTYFTELKLRLDILTKQSTNVAFNEKIAAVLPNLVELLAKAKVHGDTPPTFKAAKDFYTKIDALYPDFVKVSAMSDAYNTVTEIMGITEFYREFARNFEGVE